MGCVTLRVVHHVFGEFDEWYEMAHPRVLVTVLLMTGLGSSNDWNPLTHPPEKRSNRSRSVTVEVPAGARCSEAPRCAPYARTLARSDLAERLFLP